MNKDLTVSQLRISKSELEISINNLITNFIKENEVVVVGVEIHTEAYFGIVNKPQFIRATVTLEDL